MLVLTRKLGEKIYIGPDIALTVVDVQGGRVRLGFEAPADVRVLRAELRPFAELSVEDTPERRERQAVF